MQDECGSLGHKCGRDERQSIRRKDKPRLKATSYCDVPPNLGGSCLEHEISSSSHNGEGPQWKMCSGQATSLRQNSSRPHLKRGLPERQATSLGAPPQTILRTPCSWKCKASRSLHSLSTFSRCRYLKLPGVKKKAFVRPSLTERIRSRLNPVIKNEQTCHAVTSTRPSPEAAARGRRR